MQIGIFFLPQMEMKIAIQGIRGSFHHQVAEAFFGAGIPLEECMTFDEVASSLVNKRCDKAVMAIENSIAGSIIPNYALIDRNSLCVIGEHYLDIHHHLMALKGQKLEDLREVHSHPMALLQCMDFLKTLPQIKLVEDKDTAETARRIHDSQIPGIAAIAGKSAAEMYQLEILAQEIQTVDNNMTRFVILQRGDSELPSVKVNKASLKFELEHKRGSLAAVLNMMSDCKLNLTKIQSLPKIESPWKYAFFVDVTFEDYDDFSKAKSILSIMCAHFKVLGEYQNKQP